MPAFEDSAARQAPGWFADMRRFTGHRGTDTGVVGSLTSSTTISKLVT